MSIELYDFQREDVEKLESQFRGLIASEMGVGKTHEAIELVLRWENFKSAMPSLDVRLPSLVVAPLNTHKSWMNKLAAQAPHVRVMRIDRKDREAFIISMLNNDADVYLIHWQAVPKLIDYLTKFEYGVIVGDEIHRISNRNSKTTLAFKQLKCVRKLGMSGTATGDKPDKFWSILNWLDPDTFSSYWDFRDDFIVSSVGYGGYSTVIDVKNTEDLHKIISPYTVRHLKREACCDKHPQGVMHYLPAVTKDVIEVELLPKQRRIYNQMEEQMVAWLGENEDNPLASSVVIAQLTRLSQMAIATPKLIPKEVRRKNPFKDLYADEIKRYKEAIEEFGATDSRLETLHEAVENFNAEDDYIVETEIGVELEAPSSKIDALQDLISDHPEEQFTVFSSSRQGCYLAKKQLNDAGISAEVLSGSTPQSLRETMVEDFAARKFQVFIGVIAACGEGMDGLQESCHIAVFIDRDWQSIANEQAIARIDRGGQTMPVQIYDIKAKDTVDDDRHRRLGLKWGMVRKMLGDKIAELEIDDDENEEAA